jgi:hypothetical protein
LKSLWNYLSKVWSFIENGVQTRELCPFYFSAACCPKLISGRVALGDSGITACRNFRLSWFLICWNRNFMGLLNIPKIPSVFPSRPCRILMRSVASCALIRRRWWSWSFYLLEHHVALPCWRFRVSPMLSILIVMEEEDKPFLS